MPRSKTASPASSAAARLPRLTLDTVRALIPHRTGRYRIPFGHDDQHAVHTADGWVLPLWHYKARVPSLASSNGPLPGSSRGAVLLVHGLAANRVSFDMGEGRSTARTLAEAGFDVFAAELRGHGASHPDGVHVAPGPLSFFAYVEQDMPHLVARVRQLSAGPLFVVGHSMGGIIALAHLAQTALRGGSTLETGIDGLVTIASSLDYSGTLSGYRHFVPLEPVAKHVKAIDIGRAARAGAVLSGRVDSVFDRFNFHPGSTAQRAIRRFHANGFHAVSTAVLAELATAFKDGGLRTARGERVSDGIGALELPVLHISGTRDAQCPPPAVARTAALQPVGATHMTFGAAFGHRAEYGHMDLLIGDAAQDEVTPAIERWLTAWLPTAGAR